MMQLRKAYDFSLSVFGRQQFGNNNHSANLLYQLSSIVNTERILYVLAWHCFTTHALVPQNDHQ